ncbi:hypothetical protein V8V91_27745 [Algoriphagus halophilus]
MVGTRFEELPVATIETSCTLGEIQNSFRTSKEVGAFPVGVPAA